ncbi:hypothetical protein [Sulfitobacter sp. PS-8MA]|uniref:hypothetical protein n=1 Tax=Sulfitobacter sp. PS-8MA TaxID=3237707 RepID=UPI0034C6D0EA
MGRSQFKRWAGGALIWVLALVVMLAHPAFGAVQGSTGQGGAEWGMLRGLADPVPATLLILRRRGNGAIPAEDRPGVRTAFGAARLGPRQRAQTKGAIPSGKSASQLQIFAAK